MPRFTKEDFRRDLAPKYKLVPLLDKALADFDEPWTFAYEPRELDDAWHPSSHCLPAPTSLYEYAHACLNSEYVKATTLSLRKSGYVGHFWHQLLQTVMVRRGLAQQEHIEAVGQRAWGDGPYHWATGRADVAYCDLGRHGNYLIDFKTMSPYAFKDIGLPAGFAAKYEAQINIYMDWFDQEKALIVAIQKDSPHEMKEFEFRRDQELIDAIYDKWAFVSECLDEGEAPTELDDEQFVMPIKGATL